MLLQGYNNGVTPLLSIAIVNWNTRDHLISALESIYREPPPFKLQTIVVDNASVDGSADAVARRFPQVQLERSQTNLGYAGGNNAAMALSAAPYILLLNPDVVVPPGGLQVAVEFMQARPHAGAMGVRLRGPCGEVQKSLRGFPSPASLFWESTGLSRLFPRSRALGAYRMRWFDYRSEIEVDQPMGTFLLIRREALAQVGPMDERFPIFFNEVDWCFRCKQAGWKILFCPEVEVLHYGGASTGQVAPAMAWESRRGLLRFYGKHYAGLLFWPIRALVAVSSWPQSWLQARRRSR